MDLDAESSPDRGGRENVKDAVCEFVSCNEIDELSGRPGWMAWVRVGFGAVSEPAVHSVWFFRPTCRSRTWHWFAATNRTIMCPAGKSRRGCTQQHFSIVLRVAGHAHVAMVPLGQVVWAGQRVAVASAERHLSAGIPARQGLHSGTNRILEGSHRAYLWVRTTCRAVAAVRTRKCGRVAVPRQAFLRDRLVSQYVPGVHRKHSDVCQPVGRNG